MYYTIPRRCRCLLVPAAAAASSLPPPLLRPRHHHLIAAAAPTTSWPLSPLLLAPSLSPLPIVVAGVATMAVVVRRGPSAPRSPAPPQEATKHTVDPEHTAGERTRARAVLDRVKSPSGLSRRGCPAAVAVVMPQPGRSLLAACIVIV